MGGKDDIEELREVMKILGENLPNLLKQISDLASDQKRVAAFATSTAEFYRQLRESGVPEDKAVELTKVFMSRASPAGPLDALFNNMGGSLGDLGPLVEQARRARGSVTVRIGDVERDAEEKGSSRKRSEDE